MTSGILVGQEHPKSPILFGVLLGHQGEIGGYEGEGIDHQKAGTARV
jgi:hypothetical protein